MRGQSEPSEVAVAQDIQNALEDTAADVAPALKRFKFLATKMSQRQNTDSQSTMLGRNGRPPNTMADNIRGQLAHYLAKIKQPGVIVANPIKFWLDRMSCSEIVPLALDLVGAPASQAYVERILSLCGILTSGRRNAMKKSLAMRVFLKLNKNILLETGLTLWSDLRL